MTGRRALDARALLGAHQHYGDLLLLLGGRGVSAIASLAIIPLVSRTSGAASYGQFSVDYSLLLTIIALFSTVCLQPTYRGYDGAVGGGVFPKVTALAAGAAAAVALLALGAVFRRPAGELLAGTALVLTQTLYTGLLAIRQVRSGARAMSAYELARGGYCLAVIALALALKLRIDGAGAFLILASGYAAASFRLAPGLDFRGVWALAHCLRLMRFGALMGLWLAIGNLTYLIVKLLVRTYATPAAFAQFAIEIDIASRIVGLVGSMVVTNYFPALAKLAREKLFADMDRLMGKATIAYVALSAAGGAAWIGATALSRPETLGGLGGLALIVIGVGLYQYGSLFHKRLELSGGAGRLLAYLVLAQVAGGVAFLAAKAVWPAALAAVVGLAAAGAAYLALTHLTWTGRIGRRFRALDPVGARAGLTP